MEDKLREYEEKLVGANLKLTSQRRQILKILLETAKDHPSAEEIYRMVRDQNPRIGLATVYRTLESFCELGILHELNFDNNCRRYELEQGESHHHHLICLKCREIVEFKDDVLNQLEEHIKKEYKYHVIDHRIKFYGYCPKCQKD